MTRKLRFAMLMISVALVCVLALGIGFTAAFWGSAGGNSGENTVAPVVESPFDWNPWAKYFATDAVLDEVNLTATITTFRKEAASGDEGYVYNSEIVIIPKDIIVNDVSYKVVEVANGVFSDDVLREMPTVIYISPSVERIDMLAFSNLPNLTTVVFGVDADGNGAECVIEDFAFMMSSNLVKVVTNGRVLKDSSGADITAASAVFTGCGDTLTLVSSL